MSTPKWIPKHNNDIVKMFEQTRQLERDFRIFGKKFATDINFDLPDYYVSFMAFLCRQVRPSSEVISCLDNNRRFSKTQWNSKKYNRAPFYP